MDDIYNEWHCDIVREDTDKGKGKGELFTTKKIQNEMERKKAHMLYYMVSVTKNILQKVNPTTKFN